MICIQSPILTFCNDATHGLNIIQCNQGSIKCPCEAFTCKAIIYLPPLFSAAPQNPPTTRVSVQDSIGNLGNRMSHKTKRKKLFFNY